MHPAGCKRTEHTKELQLELDAEDLAQHIPNLEAYRVTAQGRTSQCLLLLQIAISILAGSGFARRKCELEGAQDGF